MKVQLLIDPDSVVEIVCNGADASMVVNDKAEVWLSERDVEDLIDALCLALRKIQHSRPDRK